MCGGGAKMQRWGGAKMQAGLRGWGIRWSCPQEAMHYFKLSLGLLAFEEICNLRFLRYHIIWVGGQRGSLGFRCLQSLRFRTPLQLPPRFDNGASPWHLARRCWGCGRGLLTKSGTWKHKATQNPGQGVDGGETGSLSPVRPKGTNSLFLVLLRIVPRTKSARQVLYPLCSQASVHFLVWSSCLEFIVSQAKCLFY